VLLPASFAKGNETMQSTIKQELTTSEAKAVFAITEKEIRTIRTMIQGIESQISALDEFMDAIGLQKWMSSSPRSIASAQFTVAKDG
jgi:ABC-type Zn2+ transport system substrate-binding protein/surface adhesin